MNILLVSSYLPFPLYSGGQVRLYNLIKELSKKHTITLICERRSTETDADVKEVEKICKKVLTVNRKKQWSLSNIVTTGISSHSFLVTGHTLPEMQDIIAKELISGEYDLIHVETYYVMQNVPSTNIPIVLVEHNIEYNVYERFKQKVPLPAKVLLSLDINKLRREEELSWKKATSVVAVSKDDQSVMKTYGIDATVVANGVNVDQFAFKRLVNDSKEKKILFIGDFKWLQNKDSAAFIINEIWPKIKEKVSNNVKLWIVARDIPDNIKRLTDDKNVLFDEKSSGKPTPEIFQEASVLLAPIRVGGGTSYKILESMSCGTPVVTMPLSANALEAKESNHLMVGKNAEELAEKTIQILGNDALYSKVSKNGRAFIEERYTWKEIAKVLNSVYEDAVAK